MTLDTTSIYMSQAERILLKFGGARRLSRLMKACGRTKDPTSIYKWTYSKEKGGTGGLIPTAAWSDILLVARMEGLLITSEDMDPRERKVKPPKHKPMEDIFE